MVVQFIVIAVILVCSVQAVRAPRLLLSALWLAGASAATALLIYLLGAPEVAVIELSVGAGLVTVLFVFAINISGEEDVKLPPIVPRPLALVMVLASLLLLAYLNADLLPIPLNLQQAAHLEFKNVLWEDRVLDLLLQMVLIFAGVLGVLGLLAESHPHGAAQEEVR